ncbi:MAG: hypothetical protein QOK38_1366 [Acidobacteriaceae bacterium]|jgi:hypothetical protein|nr:hypothetical protein [Acidobacteriaceae bacterium]
MPSRRIGRIAVPLCAVVLWVAAERPLLADASYKETTQITGGSIVGMMKMAGAFSSQARKANQPITSEVYVSGNRMARIRPDGTEIIDLDAGTITHIDPVKQQYTTTTFEQMRQQIEQAQRDAEAKAKEAKTEAPKQPADQTPQNVDMSFDVHVRETGAAKEVSGLNTKEAIMTMAMNATDKNTQQTGALAITNDMWLATNTPVYDEVRAFDVKFAQRMGHVFSGNQSMQGMQTLMAQPGAAKGMAEMATEVQKLKGVPILQVMRMGMTSNGQPLPAASEAPLPASNGPAMPGAGDVAQQTTTSVVASKLGGLGSALGGGGFGGFGHKKKAADPAPAQPADAPGTGPSADPASSVLIESSTTLSDFSSAPVDGSHFQVPTGYQQVTAPGLRTTS